VSVKGPPARPDQRADDALRPVRFTRRFTASAPGSVLIEMGRTKILCTATIEHKVPEWMEGKGRGWMTAEYGMLPGSTPQRKQRERVRPDGRSTEIQRLIGRSLRGVVDLELLGERTLWLDCDVLEADGGTRTAAITGAYVAAMDAVGALEQEGLKFAAHPIRAPVAAVSVGIVAGRPILDLSYEEDVAAQVDMNVVMNGRGEFIEVQGTAEHRPFTREQLNAMLDLARRGIEKLFEHQTQALKA
jgi:ribonuclease PH